MPANLDHSAEDTGLEKVSFHSNPKKCNANECSKYHIIALISNASKVMLKILQAKLQEYMNWELPDVQTRFRKAEESETKLPTSVGSYKKQENSMDCRVHAIGEPGGLPSMGSNRVGHDWSDLAAAAAASDFHFHRDVKELSSCSR